MPKINEMLLKLEGYKYSTSINLNTGYYNIRLIENSNNLCVINITWAKYHSKFLPLVFANSPYIFSNI